MATTPPLTNSQTLLSSHLPVLMPPWEYHAYCRFMHLCVGQLLVSTLITMSIPMPYAGAVTNPSVTCHKAFDKYSSLGQQPVPRMVIHWWSPHEALWQWHCIINADRKLQFDTLSAVSSESCHCLSLGRIVIIPLLCHDDVTMSHSLVTSITCGHQTPSSCRHWARMSSHPPVCEAQHVTLCQQGWSENYPWWWEHRAVISDHGNNVNYADDWDALEPG